MNTIENTKYETLDESIKLLLKALSVQKSSSLNQSEDIKELVSALSKAQGKMEAAKFNRINPHYKNRYADFTAVMDACRHPLSDNGLSVLQYCETINEKLVLVTMLAHTSGQWIKSHFPLNPIKMDSQSIGSAMTYAKRYSLSAMLGIVSDEEDDDGEAAHGRVPKVDKISASQEAKLKDIEGKLDSECIDKLYSWLDKTYNITKLEELPAKCFIRVLDAFQNALKFVEQQKLINI